MQDETKTLALFDFDGTLYRGDSFFRFVIFAKGWGATLLGLPVCFWHFYKIWASGAFNRDAAKAAVCAIYFKGISRKTLEQLGRDFASKKLLTNLRRSVLDRFIELKKNKTRLVVVTASADVWMQPVCEAMGAELLCTEFGYENDLFTGRFATPNCNRAEKKRRILDFLPIEAYSTVYVFGNSWGDSEMFTLGTVRMWVGDERNLIKRRWEKTYLLQKSSGK